MKTIFFDTEFDNFADLGLISIGFYSECGSYQLYLENVDYKLRNCSEFVKQNILPKLNNKNYGVHQLELKDKFNNWIKNIPDDNLLFLSDYGGDLKIFWKHFYSYNFPKKITTQLMYDRFLFLLKENNKNQKNINFMETFNKYLEKETDQTLIHHALSDAQANMKAWNSTLLCLGVKNATHI